VTGVLESRRLVRDAAGNVRMATAADYSLWDVRATTLPNGRIYRVPIYTLDSSLTPTGGLPAATLCPPRFPPAASRPSLRSCLARSR